MSANPELRMSEEEYLERERAAEFRSDYYAGYVYAMSGGSWTHGTLVQNVNRLLDAALRSRNCSVRSTDTRVRVSGKLYTYPDIVVVCGEPKFLDNRTDIVTNPVLIIEVLSQSTEAYDRGAKATQYRTMDSLRELVLVAQIEPRVEIYRKRPANEWVLTDVVGLDAMCRFESVDCELPLKGIYDQVTFTRNEPRAPGLL
jgi:Uma2 family endonuclease